MARMLAPLFVVLLLLALYGTVGPARAATTNIVAIPGHQNASGDVVVATGPSAGNSGTVCNGYAVHRDGYGVVTGVNWDSGDRRGLFYWQNPTSRGERWLLLEALGHCSGHFGDLLWLYRAELQ